MYFNSIKVQLKLLYLVHLLTILLNFNSIKVQLKLMRYANYPKDIVTFQFHKGTIKTPIITQTKMSLYAMGFRVQRYKKYF